jgi:acetyltransferase-like isoleucine patch superfamily enzyme
MAVDTKSRSIRSILSDARSSSARKYKALTVGEGGFFRLLAHEVFSMFLVPLPGAPGIVLRRMAYKRVFRTCGEGLIVGTNSVFRHASKISVGSGVTIDDLSLIDARGAEEMGIVFGDGVIINRNTIVQSKGGDIIIGKSVSIGANSHLVSRGGIRIGDDTVIAGGCHIAAGTFDYSDLGAKISEQEMTTAGPIVIGRNVWLARGVTILDGVRIGDDSILSAGSVVTGNIPPRSIAHGNPAKVVFTRR